jgi:hypothetical protein
MVRLDELSLQQEGIYAWNNFNCYFSFVIDWCDSTLGIQPRVGICAFWGTDHSIDHYFNSMASWRDLNFTA